MRKCSLWDTNHSQQPFFFYILNMRYTHVNFSLTKIPTKMLLPDKENLN